MNELNPSKSGAGSIFGRRRLLLFVTLTVLVVGATVAAWWFFVRIPSSPEIGGLLAEDVEWTTPVDLHAMELVEAGGTTFAVFQKEEDSDSWSIATADQPSELFSGDEAGAPLSVEFEEVWDIEGAADGIALAGRAKCPEVEGADCKPDGVFVFGPDGKFRWSYRWSPDEPTKEVMSVRLVHAADGLWTIWNLRHTSKEDYQGKKFQHRRGEVKIAVLDPLRGSFLRSGRFAEPQPGVDPTKLRADPSVTIVDAAPRPEGGVYMSATISGAVRLGSEERATRRETAVIIGAETPRKTVFVESVGTDPWAEVEHVRTHPSGDALVVFGRSDNAGGLWFGVERRDPSGTFVWRNEIDLGQTRIAADDIAVTGEGAIVIVGRLQTPDLSTATAFRKGAAAGFSFEPNPWWSHVSRISSDGDIEHSYTLAEADVWKAWSIGDDLVILGGGVIESPLPWSSAKVTGDQYVAGLQ